MLIKEFSIWRSIFLGIQFNDSAIDEIMCRFKKQKYIPACHIQRQSEFSHSLYFVKNSPNRFIFFHHDDVFLLFQDSPKFFFITVETSN